MKAVEDNRMYKESEDYILREADMLDSRGRPQLSKVDHGR